MYDSIFDPPLLAGARNETSAAVFEANTTEVTVGESGNESGTTITEAEAALAPFLLEARTEIEYEDPLLKPSIVQVNDGQTVTQEFPPGEAVAV